VSEDTQVWLVCPENSCEQVEIRAIPPLAILVIFKQPSLIENKRTPLKLLISCVVILKQV